MGVSPVQGWIEGKIAAAGYVGIERLRDYQLDRVRTTVELAAMRSRFYRERLAGVDPASIESMDDLARLPFTYPEDISADPTAFVCVSAAEIARVVTLSSSGTTGRPKRIYFTEDDLELTVDFFHRGMATMADRNDRVMVLMPGSAPGSVGDLLKKALKRLGCACAVFGPVRDVGSALRAVFDERATCLVGIPSQVLALSRAAGGKRLRGQIKSVLLSADYVPGAARFAIASAWGAEVFAHYGMTEMGYGGGVECSERDGYHLREADLLFEIVDPESGLRVPDGERGEVVFTTLTRRGMPLVRYRTGDMARFLPAPCRCSAGIRRLGPVEGRIGISVGLAGGTLSMPELDEVLFRDETVSAFSAEVCAKDGRDCLVVTVAPAGPGFEAGRLEREIMGRFPRLFAGGRLLLEVRAGETGFFTSGAAKRRIVDRRGG